MTSTVWQCSFWSSAVKLVNFITLVAVPPLRKDTLCFMVSSKRCGTMLDIFSSQRSQFQLKEDWGLCQMFQFSWLSQAGSTLEVCFLKSELIWELSCPERRVSLSLSVPSTSYMLLLLASCYSAHRLAPLSAKRSQPARNRPSKLDNYLQWWWFYWLVERFGACQSHHKRGSWFVWAEA